MPSDPEVGWEQGQQGSFRNPRLEADLSPWASEQGALWQQVQVILFVLPPSDARASSQPGVWAPRGSDPSTPLSPAGEVLLGEGTLPGLQ